MWRHSAWCDPESKALSIEQRARSTNGTRQNSNWGFINCFYVLQVNPNKLFINNRGNSKYHYYGIRVKPSSPLISTPAPDEGVLAGRGAGQTPGHKRYKMMHKSESPGDCIPEHNHSQVLFFTNISCDRLELSIILWQTYTVCNNNLVLVKQVIMMAFSPINKYQRVNNFPNTFFLHYCCEEVQSKVK